MYVLCPRRTLKRHWLTHRYMAHSISRYYGSTHGVRYVRRHVALSMLRNSINDSLLLPAYCKLYQSMKNIIAFRKRTLPTAYCQLHIDFCLLLTACQILYAKCSLTYYCLLPTASCQLSLAYWLLLTTNCLLPTAYSLLPTANCLLHAASCLLLTVNCLLPTAYCKLIT